MEEKIKQAEEIIKDFLSKNDRIKEEFGLLNDFAYLYIDNKVNLNIESYQYIEKQDELQSIQLVEDLLRSLKNKYVIQFQEVLRQKKERKEKLKVKHNLKDSFDLLHEFIYLLQLQEKEIDLNNDYLIETFSILAEFLLQDYLESIYPKNEEIYYPKINRFIYTNLFTVHMLVEFKLLQAFEKDGQIKKESLKELEACNISGSELILQNLETILDDILSLQKISYPYHKKYLIGLVLACYIHRQILATPSLIHTFCFLIENLENISLKDFLETIGLSVKKRKGTYYLTQESYKVLKKYYIEELEECVVNIKIAHTKNNP